MKTKITYGIISILLVGCGIQNVKTLNMDDFKTIANYYAATNKVYTKKFKAFRIWKEPIDSLGLSIYYVFPQVNAYAPSLNEESLMTLPTRFIVVKGNTYFWREGVKGESHDDAVNQLYSLGLFDSTYLKVGLGILKAEDASPPSVTWNETTKAAKYVFCNSTGKFIFKIKSPYDISTETLGGLHCD